MSTIKRWTALGLGAVIVAGCSEAAAPENTQPDQTAPAAAAGEGEGGEAGAGGESGESGEGGVDVAAAATDPVAFLSGVTLVEAHVRAAEAAALAGQRQAAAEMFAHPVSEVLVDIAPAFQRLGVEPLDDRLIAASTDTAGGADAAKVRAQTRDVLAALDRAAARAPAGGLANPDVTARVIADLIDRAALQYVAASQNPAYEPYLDGYGFKLTAEAWMDQHGAEIRRALPRAHVALAQALETVSAAYPQATRPERLDADTSALLAAASSARLAL